MNLIKVRKVKGQKSENSKIFIQKETHFVVSIHKQTVNYSEAKQTAVYFVQRVRIVQYCLALFFLLFTQILRRHQFIYDIVCLFQLLLFYQLKPYIFINLPFFINTFFCKSSGNTCYKFRIIECKNCPACIMFGSGGFSVIITIPLRSMAPCAKGHWL